MAGMGEGMTDWNEMRQNLHLGGGWEWNFQDMDGWYDSLI